jgi:diguanylate cyclase (GGDEF)-like protein
MARALLILRDNSKEAVALHTLDQLTGLPNRKLLTDRLKTAIAASARSGKYCGLMFLDLDKFKILNDTKGHDIGDMLLRQTEERLSACVRETDTVARLGGDEFVVVVSEISQNQEEAAAVLETIAAHILAELNRTFQFGNLTHVTSGSIGLTLFKGCDTSVEDILKQADLAMYKAKETGRNACRFFDPHMEAVVRERAALEADLLLAIAENQFQLHYQAQVGSDGQLKGAEALIRWDHPERGLVPPVAFIPFAEETGLILPLGRWVLETACNQLVAWAAHPDTADLKVAVNVSSRQFQQPDFVEQVLATLQSTGADPARLDLELTESLLVEDVDAVIEKMLALRLKGVNFTLDDFGTGYSSLFYLKRMPLGKLKIDRTFVRDLLIDPNDAAIAKTVVALAHTLGLGVVAEGVETPAQHEVLASFGCDDYQGYLFSRPLPVNRFEDFVRHCVAPASGGRGSSANHVSSLSSTGASQ